MDTVISAPMVEVKEITTLLSDRQIQAIAKKLNKDINIPILGEKREYQIFYRIIRKIDQLLCKFLPKEVYELINYAEDGITKEEAELIKRRIIPMINKHIQIPIINERQEAHLIEIVLDIIFKAIEKKHQLKEA